MSIRLPMPFLYVSLRDEMTSRLLTIGCETVSRALEGARVLSWVGAYCSSFAFPLFGCSVVVHMVGVREQYGNV
jgi:hypothetical protein